MKTNHWKRTIAGLLAMSTLFSLSFTAVSAEETTAETTAAATTTTTATTVVEIPETDMPTLSVTEEEAALFKVTPLTIKVGEESVKGLSVSGYKGTDTDVVIPDTLIDKKGNELPVFGIADGAFSGKDTITSVKMPETVTTIGANAFSGCSSLTSVNIPDAVTTLGASAFYACTSLASIHIPESITTIDADTFCSCTSLTEIELPSTLIRIGNEAFCSSGLTNITIPEGVTQVGKEAFAGCSNLVSVSIPGSLEVVSASTFQECFRLQSVTFAEGTKKILDSHSTAALLWTMWSYRVPFVGLAILHSLIPVSAIFLCRKA